MRYGQETVSISSLIRRNWLRSEMRVRINQDKVYQYAEEMEAGHTFPDPVVFVDPKTEEYIVGDGFHRIMANRENSRKTMIVDLRRGRLFDAILHNIEANRSQRGLPFDRGDRRKCIETLLTSPDSKNWTQAKIAEIVGVTVPYVTKVAQKLSIETPTIYTNSKGFPQKSLRGRKDLTSVVEKEKRRKESVRLRLQGKRPPEIAHALGVNVQVVRGYLRQSAELIKCPHCNGVGYISNL